jgi:hypothetical protein
MRYDVIMHPHAALALFFSRVSFLTHQANTCSLYAAHFIVPQIIGYVILGNRWDIYICLFLLIESSTS